jgi:hypothetical protein
VVKEVSWLQLHLPNTAVLAYSVQTESFEKLEIQLGLAVILELPGSLCRNWHFVPHTHDVCVGPRPLDIELLVWEGSEIDLHHVQMDMLW